MVREIGRMDCHAPVGGSFYMKGQIHSKIGGTAMKRPIISLISFYLAFGLFHYLSIDAPLVYSQDGEWTKIAIESGVLNKPANRSFHGMAYDSRRGVVVLHGGVNSSWTILRDTWEYDGTAWKRVNSVGPVRYVHSMAYDVERGVVVLFGGRNTGSGDPLSETWVWDGQAWKRVTTSDAPSPRMIPGMAYDPVRKVIVCHGGSFNNSYQVESDTWVWDGQTWTYVADGPQRWDCEMEYDTNKNKMVLFGGYESRGVAPTDTWEFDGKVWERIAEEGPIGRCAHSMIYDTFRGVAVMFGGFLAEGQGSPADEVHHDMWEWDGQAWRELDVPLKPKSVVFGDMVFDENRGKIVYFGGMPWFMVDLSSDTWEYSSSTSHVEKWRQF